MTARIRSFSRAGMMVLSLLLCATHSSGRGADATETTKPHSNVVTIGHIEHGAAEDLIVAIANARSGRDSADSGVPDIRSIRR